MVDNCALGIDEQREAYTFRAGSPKRDSPSLSSIGDLRAPRLCKSLAHAFRDRDVYRRLHDIRGGLASGVGPDPKILTAKNVAYLGSDEACRSARRWQAPGL